MKWFNVGVVHMSHTLPIFGALSMALTGSLILCGGCRGAPCDNDTGDDDLAGDDATDDDTGDDDSAPDDDSDDDDNSSDDDSTYASICADTGADLVVPLDQPSIQNALNAADEGGRVCVEPGTYVEQIDFLGKALELFGASGAEVTTISGGGIGPVVRFIGGEGPASVMRGFSVTDGHAFAGGGILVQESSPTLQDLVVRNNSADDVGGGIYLRNAASVLLDVSYLGNSAGTHGGGLYAEGSQLESTGMLFEGNFALGSAGGMTIRDSAVSLDNAYFAGNVAHAGCGALAVSGSELELSHAAFIANWTGSSCGALGSGRSVVRASNVLFAGNVALGGGGALDLATEQEGAYLELSNATLVGNSAGGTGGAQGQQYDHPMVLKNVIVSGNSAGYCGGLYTGHSTVVVYGDLWANLPDDDCVCGSPGFLCVADQEGNLFLDPEFVDAGGLDPASWDLHLAAASPLVNAGSPDVTDPDGSVSDMGAFGGPGADAWDLDRDGYPAWWQPGPYDHSTYPALGLDCDDLDATVHPGSGC